MRGPVPLEFTVCTFVLVLGIVYSLVFVPFVVPDESTHFRSIYSLANALMFRGPEPVMRADDLHFLESLGSSQMTNAYYRSLRDSLVLFADDPSLIVTDRIGIYALSGVKSPQVFLAPALGLALAQLMGLGTIPAIYLSRIFNLIYFVALLFFAIRIIPQGKRIIAVVALLPMTLQQVASLSYDAGILGMSFLLFALIMKAITEEGDLSVKTLVGILVFSTLLAPCKVVYSLILLLVLFIPPCRFKNRRQSIIFK